MDCANETFPTAMASRMTSSMTSLHLSFLLLLLILLLLLLLLLLLFLTTTMMVFFLAVLRLRYEVLFSSCSSICTRFVSFLFVAALAFLSLDDREERAEAQGERAQSVSLFVCLFVWWK